MKRKVLCTLLAVIMLLGCLPLAAHAEDRATLKITANTTSWEYDSATHSDGGYTVQYGEETYFVNAGESCTLPTGDTVSAEITSTIKNAGSVRNEIFSFIVDNSWRYSISAENGTLTVHQATLTITADSNSWEYDKEEHFDDGWQDIAPSGLGGNDVVNSVTVTGKITEVGKVANVPSNAVVMCGEEDVTKNYVIRYVNGTLEITEPAKYTVTFSMNGHGTAPAGLTVKSGDKAAKPDAPTADGFTFKGWFTDAACTAAYNFDAPVEADLTLFAKWEPIEYTVTFAMNGHGTAPADLTVKYGDKAAKPDAPTADGFTFKGWFTDEALTAEYDFETPVKADLTLYAKWEPIEYTVTFSMNGHGTAPAGLTVKHGDKAAKPDAPAADGFTFKGWFTDEALTAEYDFETPVKADLTLYAKWEPIKYTVTFVMNGHGTTPDDLTVKYGDKLSKPDAPAADGFTFKGWFTDEALTAEYDFETPVKANLTLYAKWEPIEYTVTFVMNGHGTTPDDLTVKYGDKFSKPDDPTADGFTFKGWFTDERLTVEYDFETPVKADLTLYAKWEDIGSAMTPKTGDHYHLILWAALFVLSGCAVIPLTVRNRKKEN